MSTVNPPDQPGMPGSAGGQPPRVPPTQPVPTQSVPTQGYPSGPQQGYPPGPQQGYPPGPQQRYPVPPQGSQPGFPGGQQGYPVPPQGGQPGFPGGQQGYPVPPRGPQGPGGPAYGGPPRNSNNKLLIMVIAGVVIAAIIGGILMFAFGKKEQDPTAPDVPTVTGPAGPGPKPTAPTGSPTPTSTPTTRATGGTAPPASGGNQVDVAHGVRATLPAGWEVSKQVSGGILVNNKAASAYLQIQAFTGQKQTNLQLCQLLEDAAGKNLGNVKKAPCKTGPDAGRVKTAMGAVSGTYSTSQGSLTLSTAVFAGVRDDGLVTGTQLTYPAKQPPTDAQLKEVVAIWASVIVSQDSQS
jgi:hypothetical protein